MTKPTPELTTMAAAMDRAFAEAKAANRFVETVDLARAALRAIREPTDAMIEAGLTQWDECTDGGTTVSPCVIEHAWPKMVDVVLGEESGRS